MYSACHNNTSSKNGPTLKLNKEVLSAYQKKIETTFDSFCVVLQSIVEII